MNEEKLEDIRLSLVLIPEAFYARIALRKIIRAALPISAVRVVVAKDKEKIRFCDALAERLK